MRIAVYEPDIPQNLGAIMRLAACMGVPTDVVGPCGFPFSIENPSTDKKLKYANIYDRFIIFNCWKACCS